MKPLFYRLILITSGCVLAGCNRTFVVPETVDSSVSASGPVSFNTHIQPILSENCYHCHGPDSGTREPEKEPLRLDREKYAFENRADGKPVIVKGDAGASLLVRLLKSKDPDEMMPPPKSHKELTPDQIAMIERWVDQGAIYEEHWSFIPPKRPEIPSSEAAINPVDTEHHVTGTANMRCVQLSRFL